MSYTRYLNSLCTIQALSTSQNAYGGIANAYTTGTQYICRLNSFFRQTEDQIADRTAPSKNFKLFLEKTAPISETSRIISSGITYNTLIVGTFDNARAQHHKEAILEVIQ